VTHRAFTGIPSMAVAPKGRFWATWYAGVTPAEDQNNYVVLVTSGDGGATWQEALTVDPDAGGPVRAFDPELWVSPDGRLRLFWAQMDRARRDAELGVWCIETSEPDGAEPHWTAPRRLGDGVMMCKPLTLSSGEWALPISTWREHDHSAQMIVSTDSGKSWTLRGGCNVPVADRQFDEHMFIERRDGTLWLLVRTKYGIGESVSTDRGKTWPELKPSSILHPSARFFIRRLASGNLLLVKHGPLDTRTGRSHLTAYTSTDDGRTWRGGLMLDERPGVSYPDGQQTADGLIRIIYDYNRTTDRNILLATFREEDAAAGKAVTDVVRLRQLVSRATGGQEKPTAPTPPVNANADGQPMRRAKPGTLARGGEPVKIILDTDMSGDADDAGTLALLHALADRGECELLAAVVNRKDKTNASAAAVDAINTYYGRPGIPIGTDKQGPTDLQRTSAYTRALRDEFPSDIGPDDRAPDAVDVYRRVLAAQPDGRVTICSVGALSNLAELWRREPQLVRAKVRRLVVMGGEFPASKKPETNIRTHREAARVVAAEWPGEILWHGFEVGRALITGARLKLTPRTNPVRRAYELQRYGGRPSLEGGQPSYDQAAALFAVHGAEPELWEFISGGRVRVDAEGVTTWHADATARHAYVKIAGAPQRLAAVIEALMIAPPKKPTAGEP
jgi:inosine-uridine nucleoside N-ribohydrolase